LSEAPALAVVGRPHPSSIEAERACLGAVMIEGAGALRDLDELAIDDLMTPAHREILAAMRDLRGRGVAVDLVTLEAEMRARGQMGRLDGGATYLVALAGDAPCANLKHHVGIVRDLAARRRLIAAGADLASRAHGGDDPGAIIDETRAQLARIGSGRADVEIATASEIAAAETEPLPPTISTGIGPLDAQLGGGLYGESIYVFPGATGRGKSGLVLQIGGHVSKTVPVLVISTELRARQIVARIAAQILGRAWLDLWKNLHHEQEAVREALADRRLVVVDGAIRRDIAPRQIADRVAQRTGQRPLMIVDYLQDLTRRRGSALDDRRLAVAATSDEIRQWALDTGGTALIVSSAARTWGDSTGGDRQLRDYAHSAKESGDVDADAAAIVAVDVEPCPPGGVTTATLRVAKSRYFTPGEVRLEYVGAMGLFRVPTGPVLTPLEREVVAAIKKGADSRNTIAKATGGGRAKVLGAVAALIGRGVLTDDLELAEGEL
jgi:replicative DNA helicase